MKKNMKRWAGVLLALVLALSLAACASVGDEQKDPAGVVTNGATVGTGAKTFAVEVTDSEGKVTAFTVKTDEKTVGAALLAGIGAGVGVATAASCAPRCTRVGWT